MKRLIPSLLSSLIFGGVLFGTTVNTDINKKLDLIMKRLNRLEQKLQAKDQQISQLKRELKKQQQKQIEATKKFQQQIKTEVALKNCHNIKVKDFSYTYYDDIIPYYTLQYTIVNNYPQPIKFLKGKVVVEDRDHVTLMNDFISREVTIGAKGGTTQITKSHYVNSELEKELNGENPKNLRTTFDIIKIEFANGKTLECF